MIRPCFTQSCNKTALRISIYAYICHVASIHVSFTNTDLIPISHYTPLSISHCSPQLFLVFASFLPCSSSFQNLTAALRGKKKPSLSPNSLPSKAGLSIPLLYLSTPVFHRDIFLACFTSSFCLML